MICVKLIGKDSKVVIGILLIFYFYLIAKVGSVVTSLAYKSKLS